MGIISKTRVTLDNITIYHGHLKGEHKGLEHAHGHTGSLSLVFKSQQGIGFLFRKLLLTNSSKGFKAF